ncbi:hypothetical protein [Nitrosopumilus sp.]|uniref:hypothetical protein n=1 Tax=Nitrosopumilus sp. TaxID=2024843 RepID=UPI003B5AB40C
MVNKSIIMVATLASVVAIGLAASATFVTAESSETMSDAEKKNKSFAPRYSETCAHGHNGFACDPPQYKKDIKDLQEKVSALEQRVSRP